MKMFTQIHYAGKILFKVFNCLSFCFVLLGINQVNGQSTCNISTDGCAGFFDNPITRVEFLNVNNPTGGCDNSGGYVDHTDLTAVQCGKNDFQLTVEKHDYYCGNLIGWVDWDQDGQFEQSEVVMSENGTGNTFNDQPQTYSTTVNVPASTSFGNTYHLRLISVNGYAGFNNPCDYIQDSDGCGPINQDGEVEDYSFTLLDPTTPISFDQVQVNDFNEKVGRGQPYGNLAEVELDLSAGCVDGTIDSLTFTIPSNQDIGNNINSAAVINYDGGGATYGVSSMVEGNPINNPVAGNTYTVAIEETTSDFKHYFGIAYNVKDNAIVGDVLETRVDSITVNGNNFDINQTGSREIKSRYWKNLTNFESGSLESWWSTNRNSDPEIDVSVTSSSSINPLSGNYMLQLDSDNPYRAHADMTLNSNAIGDGCKPGKLRFWWTHNEDEDDGIEGIEISLDGGNNFDQVYNHDIDDFGGPNSNNWQNDENPIIIDIAQYLDNNNEPYPSSNDIIIRLQHEATISGEYHFYDSIDIEVVPENARPQYDQTTVTQISDSVGVAQNNARILEFNIQFKGLFCKGKNLGQVWFSTNGSTNPSNDIASAKLLSNNVVSGINTAPDPDNEVVSDTINNPSGKFTLNVNESYNSNNNFFSLVYNVDEDATVGNDLDATLDSFMLGGQKYVLNEDPSGERTISKFVQYCQVSSNRNNPGEYVGIDSLFIKGKRYQTPINNNSSASYQGLSPDFHHFYRDDSAVVYQSETVPVSLTSGRKVRAHVKAWADWNKNGFFEPSERVFQSSGSGFFNGENFNFDIPCDADTGFVTLRIATDQNLGNIQQCGNFGEGEIEDISLYIKEQHQPSAEIVSPDTFYVNSPDTFRSELNAIQSYSVNWDFNNDGNYDNGFGDKTEHTFTSAGTRTVGMELSETQCASGPNTATATKTIDVVQPNRAPDADFIALKNTLEVGEIVEFRDVSRFGPTNWEWEIQPFEVRTDSSHRFMSGNKFGKDPRVRFLKKGRYDVRLIAGNDAGKDTIVKKDFIVVGDGHNMCSGPNMSKDATGVIYGPNGRNDLYGPQRGTQTCQFLINPDCADSIKLTLNKLDISSLTCGSNVPDNLRVYDGTSTNDVPLHLFEGASNGFHNGSGQKTPFTVTATSGAMLIVWNKQNCGIAKGFEGVWKTYQKPSATARNAINNNQIVNLPDTVYQDGVVTFTSQMRNPGLEFKWDLPSGKSFITDNYRSDQRINGPEGNKEVKLITRQCGYADTTTASFYLKPVENAPVTDFEASSTSIDLNDTIRLNDLSLNGPTSWQWSFNTSDLEFVNKTDANSKNPYITFTSAGTYNVQLIASNKEGRSGELKVDYINVSEPPSCTPSVNITNNDLSINRFTIKDLDGNVVYQNQSGLGTNGYSKFNTSGNLTLTKREKYVVQFNRTANTNPASYGMWIDINADNNLTPDERFVFTSNDTTTQYTDTFTLPSAVPAGGNNLIRAIINLGNEPIDPCGTNFSGEAEDYIFRASDDTTAPSLTLKGPDQFTTVACGDLSNDTGALAVDNVDGNITGKIQIDTDLDLTTEGTYDFTYVVSDNSGNTTRKTQVITVEKDDVKPVIQLNGGDTVDKVVFSGPFQRPGYNAMDTCSGLDTSMVSGEINPNIVGHQNLTYTATDKAGNTRVKKRVVRVMDTVDPTARLSGNDTMRINVFEGYEEPGVFANDNYYDSVSVSVEGSVNTDELGEYPLTYHVTDVWGNETTLNRLVIVEDQEAPIVTNIPNGVYTLDVLNKFVNPMDVSDNFYHPSKLNVTKEGSFYDAFPNGYADSLGTFSAMISYEDPSGNETTISLTIEVADREAPVLNLLGQSIAQIKRFSEYKDSMGHTFEVNDNFYSDDAITLNRFGSYFTDYMQTKASGTFEIRYQAVDPSGNRSPVKVRGIQTRSTGIEDDVEGVNVTLFPNPNQGRFQVELELANPQYLDVDIIDGKGQLVKNVTDANNSSGGTYNVDLSTYASGTYQLKVQTESDVITKSFVITK